MASYVLHLWVRKWWILGLTILATVAATAALMMRKTAASYTVNALLYVKERPQANEQTEEQRHPLIAPNYRQLLLSDALLAQVADQLRKETPPIEANLSRLRGALEVGTEMEVDTTVERLFSPLISVTAHWSDGDGARKVAEVWLNQFITLYGNLQSQQAQVRVEALKHKADSAMQRFREIEGKRSLALSQMEYKRQILQFRQAQLAPMLPIPWAESDIFMPNADSTKMQVQMPASVPSQIGPGLLAEHSLLQQKIAVAMDEGAKAGLQQQLQANEAEQSKMNREIQSLQKEVSSLAEEYGALNEERHSLQTELALYASNEAEAAVAGAGDIPSGKLDGVEVKVVAAPVAPVAVMPVAPVKKIAAVAAVSFLLFALLFIFEKYLRDAQAAA